MRKVISRFKSLPKSKKRIIAVIAAILVLVSSLGGIYAKYVRSYLENAQVVPKNFYFESNYLKSSAENASYTVYKDYIDIVILNNDGIAFSENDIKYSLSVDSGNGSFDTSSGTLAKGAKNSASHRLSGDGKVKVTATVEGTYSKSITAEFDFRHTDEETYYSVTDKGNHILLDIYVGENLPESITVNYGTKFIPDNTNDFMLDWINSTSGTIINGYEKDSHYELVFYKTVETEVTKVTDAVLSQDNTIVLE